jgi:rhomboid family GlyGly-CTERM serine protease
MSVPDPGRADISPSVDEDTGANGLAPVAAVWFGTSVIVACAGGTLASWLRYERSAVQAGQWWRLLSAHVVHLGWGHMLLNGAALAVASSLWGRLYRAGEWAVLAAVSALGVGVGLYLASPRIAWYVGLSGMTHGLVAAAGVALVAARRRSGWLCLSLLAAKLAWEQLHGAVPGSTMLTGATVVDAHLDGAVAGLFGGVALRLRPGQGQR